MNLKLLEILDASLTLAILKTWSQGKGGSLRKVSETLAAATEEILAGEKPELGQYLVETAGGLEFLEVIGAEDHLCLTADGRGFPQERAHYVFAVVHLVQEGLEEDVKGENQNGHETDQG